MRVSVRRRGATLVELLVAATVGTIICASAYAVLLHLRRSVEMQMQRASADRLGTDVVTLLEALGAHLRYPVVLGDTALQAELRIGIGVGCQWSPASLTLAPALSGSLDAMTVLTEFPAPGDRVDVLRASGDSGAPMWVTATLAEVGMLAAKTGCDPESPLLAPSELSRPVWRFTAPAEVGGTGAPVELYRPVRLIVYHAGDLGWTVGMRHCGGAICSAAQPIIGPVRAPRDGGLRFVRTPSDVTVQVRVPMLDKTFSGVIVAIDPAP